MGDFLIVDGVQCCVVVESEVCGFLDAVLVEAEHVEAVGKVVDSCFFPWFVV